MWPAPRGVAFRTEPNRRSPRDGLSASTATRRKPISRRFHATASRSPPLPRLATTFTSTSRRLSSRPFVRWVSAVVRTPVPKDARSRRSAARSLQEMAKIPEFQAGPRSDSRAWSDQLSCERTRDAPTRGAHRHLDAGLELIRGSHPGQLSQGVHEIGSRPVLCAARIR